MTDMPESTGGLRAFDLFYLGNNNLVLNFPEHNSDIIPPYQSQDLIIKVSKVIENG